MTKDRDNIGGGASNGAPSPSSSPEPPADDYMGEWLVGCHNVGDLNLEPVFEPGPRQDLQYARQCVTALLMEYANVVAFCHGIHEHRLTLPEHQRNKPTEVAPVAREVNRLMHHLLDVLTETVPNVAKVMPLLDAQSRGPVTIGDNTTTNTHAAIVGLGLLAKDIFRECGLHVLRPREQQNQGAIEAWTRTIRHGIPEFVTLMADTPPFDLNVLLASAGIEYQAAVAAAPASEFVGEEGIIVDTLRREGKPLTQGKLCHAAGLKWTGTRNALLHNMVERGILTNHGKGYGLPEWEEKPRR